jgi:hypothetical protein
MTTTAQAPPIPTYKMPHVGLRWPVTAAGWRWGFHGLAQSGQLAAERGWLWPTEAVSSSCVVGASHGLGHQDTRQDARQCADNTHARNITNTATVRPAGVTGHVSP